MFCCCVQRNQCEEKRFALSRCKRRVRRSLSVSCPRVQQWTGGRGKNQSGQWGQGQGGLQGSRRNSSVQGQKEEEEEEEKVGARKEGKR